MSQGKSEMPDGPISFIVTFPSRSLLEQMAGAQGKADKPPLMEQLIGKQLKICAPRGQDVTVKHQDPAAQ